MKSIALIPAAGSGNRMGKKQKKQFLNLAGQPMLTRTVLLFQNCEKIDEIILVIPKEDIEYCKREIIEKFSIHKVRKIVAGGENRGQSVYNGLVEIINPDPEDIVLIHDGARPFVSAGLVDSLITYMAQHPQKAGVIPILPVKDTIKVVKKGKIKETPSRGDLFAAQTPQCFNIIKLMESFGKAQGHLDMFTDESSMMEYLGHSIGTLAGEERNIKITTPQDLLFAQYLLERERKDV